MYITESTVFNESFVTDKTLHDDDEDSECEEHWDISDEELSGDDQEEHEVCKTSAKENIIYLNIFLFLWATY